MFYLIKNLSFFLLFISQVAFSQSLSKKSYYLNYIISNTDTCNLTDLDLMVTFKPRNLTRKYNRLYIKGNNANIRTIGYYQSNSEITFRWSIMNWNRGHSLYNYCFEDFKKAFNNTYSINISEEKLTLSNINYKLILETRSYASEQSPDVDFSYSLVIPGDQFKNTKDIIFDKIQLTSLSTDLKSGNATSNYFPEVKTSESQCIEIKATSIIENK